MTEADFSGYVTKAGLKCSDGRTIDAGAFKHQDKIIVPLVWQHGHNDPKNVLGHVELESRDDGVYGRGFFNSTDQGKNSKLLVEHGDITAMSIFANKLVERDKLVLHGMIREVSLCIAGANEGARIDYVRIAHSEDPDEDTVLQDEAVISMGLELEHAMKTHQTKTTTTTTHLVDGVVKGTRSESSESTRTHEDDDLSVAYGDSDEGVEHAEDKGKTMKEILDTLNDDQKQVVEFMLGEALAQGAADADDDGDGNSAAQSDTSTDSNDSTAGDSATNNEGDLTHQEGSTTVSNVFEADATGATASTAFSLNHADVVSLLDSARKGGSFKEAFKAFAEEKSISHSELQHSITNLELLFPEAKTVTDDPQWVSRRMEWVSSVLGGTRKSPFSKIKTTLADITADEARAKGYVKGNQKVEEVLVLLRRTTGPTTIYKKQGLDRDDMIDITDIDIVLWLKAEMRLMIEEELARAILVGDGRLASNPDKVKDPAGSQDGNGIRSILHDSDLYAVKADLAANVSAKDAVKGLVRARSKYRGSGKPTLFISDAFLTDIMLEEDKFGRALYETEAALRDKLRVGNIVTVDLFDEHDDLFAIMVSLSDYTIGTNKGGELTSFEDFDIDFNKYKYLQETRLSGGLTKPYSAVVVRRAMGTLATPVAPSFDGTTDTVTIPTVTGVVYSVDGVTKTGSFVITSPTEIDATPATGYYFERNITTSWTYTP